jgi:hypothetical protein
MVFLGKESVGRGCTGGWLDVGKRVDETITRVRVRCRDALMAALSTSTASQTSLKMGMPLEIE